MKPERCPSRSLMGGDGLLPINVKSFWLLRQITSPVGAAMTETLLEQYVPDRKERTWRIPHIMEMSALWESERQVQLEKYLKRKRKEDQGGGGQGGSPTTTTRVQRRARKPRRS